MRSELWNLCEWIKCFLSPKEYSFGKKTLSIEILALHVTELDLADFSKPERFQIWVVASFFFSLYILFLNKMSSWCVVSFLHGMKYGLVKKIVQFICIKRCKNSTDHSQCFLCKSHIFFMSHKMTCLYMDKNLMHIYDNKVCTQDIGLPLTEWTKTLIHWFYMGSGERLPIYFSCQKIKLSFGK